MNRAVLNAGISGGLSGYVATGRLNGAIWGSLEGIGFAGVHFAKADLGVYTSTWGGAEASAGIHGLVGGMISMAAGRNFKSGFLVAGFSDLAGDDGEASSVDARATLPNMPIQQASAPSSAAESSQMGRPPGRSGICTMTCSAGAGHPLRQSTSVGITTTVIARSQLEAGSQWPHYSRHPYLHPRQ